MVELKTTKKLGERISKLRREKSLTLEELADRSGVSRAMLSKIERQEKNPTVSVVVKIAKGLGVSLFDILGDLEERKSVVLINKSKRMVVKDPETGFERQLLSPTFGERGAEVMYHIIPKGGSSGDLPAAHAGVEKYLILEKGQLDVTLSEQVFSLETGDTLYFEGDQPHRFDNTGKGVCTYYLIVANRLR